VRSPEGKLLPDLYGKLPGRGVHLCPDFNCFRQAVENNSFSRSFRAPTRVDDAAALFEVTLESSRDQVRAMLSTAVRSGWLLAGRTAVRPPGKAPGGAGDSPPRVGPAVRYGNFKRIRIDNFCRKNES
jgi:predicted RNA-binding protein YlxR (DUF448 family)